MEETKKTPDQLQQQLLNNLYDYVGKMNQVLESFNISVQALSESFNERQRQTFEQANAAASAAAEVPDET